MKKVFFYFLCFILLSTASTAQENKKSAVVSETMPEFIGGDEGLFNYLNDNLVYPLSAQTDGVSGTVYLKFLVNEKGEVVNPEVVKGVREDLDFAALEFIQNMPNWKPGEQNGIPIKVLFSLPINFIINE